MDPVGSAGAAATSRGQRPFGIAEILAIVAIILIWGYSNIAAQQVTHVLPPLLTAALRFAIALIPLLHLVRPPFLSWGDALVVILIGGPAQFGLLYLAFSMVDVIGPLVVTLQLWIPLAALLAWALLGERIAAPGLAGLAVSFAGVAYMSLEPVGARDGLAIMIGLASCLMGALATVWVRRLPPIGPFKLQALVCLGCAPVLLIFSLMFEGDPVVAIARADAMTWVLILVSSIGSTLIATVLMFWLVQRHGAGRITPWFLATPLVSVVLSTWILDERITAQVLTGGAAVLGGVVLLMAGERHLTRRRA